jgi:signal recognition particle receptor subunit beta
MVFARSEPESTNADANLPIAIKIVIAGAFGVGKTTLVSAVTEIQPLMTEEYLTDRGVGIDDLDGIEAKTTTTVAMDFGRITINEDIVMYLFGTPGQERFLFLWDELAVGALGAVVLADTRRLADCFASVTYFEQRGVPFVMAVNCFYGQRRYRVREVQLALNLDPDVPVLLCDARSRESGKEVLITVVEHAMRIADLQRVPDRT